MRAVGMKWGEAANVDVPEVERCAAADDPFSDEPACAARVGDARGVESGTHEVAPQLGRFAENEIAVYGEALGTIQEHLDLGGLETRRAMDGIGHQDFEVLPVLGKQLKFKSIGN